MLKRNLRYLRKQKGDSQMEVALALAISRSAYADYENGKSEPTVSVLVKLSEYFKVNVDDLLKTDFENPLSQQHVSDFKGLQNRAFRIVTITLDKQGHQNIEFVPVTAIAGYGQNYDNPKFIGDLPCFSVPKLTGGTFRAFEIKGDSMPPIDQGFIVIGKFIAHFSDLKNGRRYVLILREEGVVFKRVINEVNESRTLILTSDNPEYMAFSVHINDVLEAWEMVSFIGYPSFNTNSSQIILEKLHSLDHKLENLLTSNSKQK